ncbi:MAG: GNAT family N-acetyltransferase [Actinomycetota bacterium]|nr:GNAT family N-acetyltransferase [Actinomycetota bacterium]
MKPPAVAIPDAVELRVADPSLPPGAVFLAAMTAELAALYGDPDRLAHPHLDPAELTSPTGCYLVAWVGDEPVAGGGLRRLTDTTAEIKRMYVDPTWRGRRVAAVLLEGLEDAARSLGYRSVRLDTGPRQPHARRLYERAGYRAIPPYNDNRYAVFWGQKTL